MPVAATATRDGVCVGANRKYEELTGYSAAELVGRTASEIFALVISPRDHAIFGRLVRNRESAAPQSEGSLWCNLVCKDGRERPVRVEWRLHENGHDSVQFTLDARPEALGQEVTAALARVAGDLSRCATEEEVLQRAVDALAERGFVATVLLWDEDDPLLRYGPSRAPGRPSAPLDLPRPARDLLARLNPGFLERRAAFFQDGVRLVTEAYPEPVADRLLALLPAERMVQAPLFLGEEPYGALVVTGSALTPLLATALDLFAELVGKAIEAVRLRQERVQRERMAALGEAAAVMAHEVRNPVGAIMNALALLDRREAADEESKVLLAIISEEATRLAQIVSQLLELGRPLHPRPRAEAMEDVALRAIELLAKRGTLPGPALEVPARRATRAWLDPALAELAILNVVQNAVQSTGGKGRVRISVDEAEEHVRCVVEDDGPGIPEAVRSKLGQPFVTTRATGTGMGLAVVRRIMEASDGYLLVEAAPPAGTRVVLAFPRAPESVT